MCQRNIIKSNGCTYEWGIVQQAMFQELHYVPSNMCRQSLAWSGVQFHLIYVTPAARIVQGIQQPLPAAKLENGNVPIFLLHHLGGKSICAGPTGSKTDCLEMLTISSWGSTSWSPTLQFFFNVISPTNPIVFPIIIVAGKPPFCESYPNNGSWLTWGGMWQSQ